ncbi:unnamed protein product [Heterosigma akashiwo]
MQPKGPQIIPEEKLTQKEIELVESKEALKESTKVLDHHKTLNEHYKKLLAEERAKTRALAQPATAWGRALRKGAFFVPALLFGTAVAVRRSRFFS